MHVQLNLHFGIFTVILTCHSCAVHKDNTHDFVFKFSTFLIHAINSFINICIYLFIYLFIYSTIHLIHSRCHHPSGIDELMFFNILIGYVICNLESIFIDLTIDLNSINPV